MLFFLLKLMDSIFKFFEEKVLKELYLKSQMRSSLDPIEIKKKKL